MSTIDYWAKKKALYDERRRNAHLKVVGFKMARTWTAKFVDVGRDQNGAPTTVTYRITVVGHDIVETAADIESYGPAGWMSLDPNGRTFRRVWKLFKAEIMDMDELDV